MPVRRKGDPINSISDLTRFLNCSSAELRSVADRADTLYRTFSQFKPSGGHRLIEAPHRSFLRPIQRKIGRSLSKRIDSPIAYGVPGRIAYRRVIV